MNFGKQLGIDAAVAAGLLLALGAVYKFDRGPAKTEGPPPKVEEVVEVVTETAPPKPLRIAVTQATPNYDEMGPLLKDLGYKVTTIPVEDIAKPGALGDFDILFLCCSDTPKAWTQSDRKEIAPGLFSVSWRPDMEQKIKESLRKFVGDGGSIYASDLHFSTLAVAFPEYVRQPVLERGLDQDLVAEVIDPGLKAKIGGRLALKFDLGGWCPASFKVPDRRDEEHDMRAYLQGDYRDLAGRVQPKAPLLVKLLYEKGSIIFTSFHNEKQNSAEEKELLRYLVFATVTAAVESKITKTMVKGGFSPQQSNLLATKPGEQKVTQTYSSKKDGKLQFALGFNNEGAKLRLEVATPDGRSFSKEGKSSFTVEVPDAKKGEYRYTVTALEVPYANFPFNLTVGEQ